jgi:replicative DNA helicase
MWDLNWKSLEMYHDRLIELWKKREINKILQKTHVLLSESSDAAVSHINEKIRGIWVDKKTSFDFMDIVKDVLDSECVNDEKLDGKIQGFRQWQLVIVSGRPWMGKTMFATNLLFRNIANGYKAVFFSLEMTPTQITQRLLTKWSKVPLSNIMSKSYTHAQEDALWRAYTKFLELEPNVKIETKAFSISDIILKIRYYNFVDWVKIFYIDQLQRISAKGENRIFEIEKITNELKKIAMDLWIVIILMCQLNREAANKEPQLINLKNSWAIEQDADIVLFPHRDNYWEGEMKTDKIRVIIAKNRNGGESEVELWLDQSIMHIYDI